MKGQITMFIIIGILVVAAFGITLYAASRVTKSSEVAREQFSVESVRDYITTCLELSANDALEILGSQGGVIYESQGGTTPDSVDKLDYNGRNVSYTVLPPDADVGFFKRSTPDYPFETFPEHNGQMVFAGFYGLNRLPPLYKTSPNSIQASLESYINNNLVSCANFSKFEEQHGFSFNTSTSTVSLLFAENLSHFVGEQNINVQLNWPVEISTPTGEKSDLENFAVRLPVRLATFYFFVKNLVGDDVSDISFEPISTNDYSITVVQNVNNYESVIEVSDSRSIVHNKPFEFVIARKNRLPALWMINGDLAVYVTDDNLPISISPIDESSAELKIDSVCPGKDPVSITLRATDPDENVMTFEADELFVPSRLAGQSFSFNVLVKDAQEGVYDYERLTVDVRLCFANN